MAISAGDAVLKFLGDTTNVDAAFASLGPKTKAAVEPATEAMGDLGDAAEDAGERTSSSMREAKGEVALLGEEFGIRLPRHVRSFVAELPGVGSAMSAAFSATAVLFIVQALAQGAEKLSEWISKAFIFTQALQDSNSEISSQNVELLKLNKQYDDAKARLASLTEGPLAKLRKEEDDLTTAFQKNAAAVTANKTLHEATKGTWDSAKDTVMDFGKAVLSYTTGISLATSAENDYAAAVRKQQGESILLAEQKRALDEQAKAHDEELRQTRIKDSLEELENQKKVALATATTEEDKYQLEQFYQNKKLSLVKEFGEKERSQVASLAAELQAEQIQHAQKIQDAWVKMLQTVKENQVGALDTLSHSTIEATVAFGPLLNNFVKAEDLAHSLGITLRTDLVDALNRAKMAKDAFVATGIVDPAAFAQFEKQIADAQKALDNFGKTEDTFKIKSKGMWAEFQRESKDGATSLDLVKQSGVTAFDDLNKNIGGAFSQMVMGEGNVGKALERATASSLASIASQAAVKALFYTAEGFAALAGFNSGSAANYFTAAGEMAAVAGAAGVAGRALSGAAGGGGSSSNTQQNYAGSSSTSGSGLRGGTSVRGFADGGLISSPTLAMIAENPGSTEAVLPLDDEAVMSRIGASIARHGSGGGGDIHLHLPGGMVVSPDSLGKFLSKVNQRVKRGQSTMLSSNSLRINKRSA